MKCYISFRDITFTPSTEGVRIIATTDVPSHIYVRLSTQEPWIHKKPVLRRGMWLVDDIRFCFTVYEDNEQFEPGETYTHTFWKPNWPVCTTKYLYLWGMQGANVCESSSPIFKYHNDGVSPVPVPDVMHTLNSIDPQFYTFPGGSAWSLADLSRDIPVNATGAILQFMNMNAGSAKRCALRKPGAVYDNYFPVDKLGTFWAIVGLDDDRCFQYRFADPGYLHAYLMGYTGPDVVFPDYQLDIKPAVNNVYSSFNIKANWPEAILLLTDLGSNEDWNSYHSIRPLGSAKEIYGGSFHMFPFCGVPPGGFIQTKLSQRAGPSTRWTAYAYIKVNCSFSLDGIDLAGFTTLTWKVIDCGGLDPSSLWAFLEYYHPFTAQTVSVRKRYSFFDYAGSNNNHGWMITHIHHTLDAQIWTSNTAASDELLHIAESH